jgi:tRNA dimethylallyltransferase
MKKIIILGGPTASGKSKFALNLAKLVDGEIINADSMQVYKYFSILTSQPKNTDYKIIPHHLYGYVETNIKYNAVKWLNDTNTKIAKLLKNNKTPIVVGGSGLYLEFLCKGVNNMPQVSTNTKEKVSLLLQSISDTDLLDLISKVDKKYSLKLNIADKFRISKLLEVYFETKKNITYFHSKNKKINNYNFFKVFISPHKNKVRLNIKNRFFKMLEEGLIEEFKKYRNKAEDSNIKNAIGFKEINSYIENKATLEETTNLIVKKTKNFSKRQYTWFENRFDQNLKIDGEDNLSLVVETFKKII